MAVKYRLTAKPNLRRAGKLKGRLETVTFIAESEVDLRRKWWVVSGEQFDQEFSTIVPPEVAKKMVANLCGGIEVEFPGRYEEEDFGEGFACHLHV